MKIYIQQSDLNKGISVVKRAVSTKPIMPILGNILLVAEMGKLKLTATNLEITETLSLNVRIESPGQITLPAGIFSEIVANLPNDSICLEQIDMSVSLKCGKHIHKIKGVAAEDFPQAQKLEDDNVIKISSAILDRALKYVSFAKGADNARPILSGVYMNVGEKLTLVCADGNRLAIYKTNLPTQAPKVAITLPAKAISEISSYITAEETINICIGTSQALFKLKDFDLISQLIQGIYPNYDSITPTTFITKAVTNTVELLKIIKLASIYSSIHIDLGITQNTIRVSSNSEDGDSSGEVDAVVTGENMEVSINPGYLTDVLKVITEEKVSLEFVAPDRPVVIRPVGFEGYTYCLAPVYIPRPI